MEDSSAMLDFTNIKEEELPEIISKQFIKLEELENNVQKAVQSAVKAKEQAQNAKVSAGVGKKKYAIEVLQDAVEGSSDALITLSEAQKISFEYQSKLAQITKYLFGLGVSNIAMNRSVVKELMLKLKEASEEDISELAWQELKNVVLQLKSQEDFMEKQEFLTKKVKEQDGKISKNEQEINNLGKQGRDRETKISDIGVKIEECKKNLDKNFVKKTELEREIQSVSQKNIKSVEILKEHIFENLDSMDKNISLIGEKLEKQTEELNDSIQKNSSDFENKLLNISAELKGDISELKEEVRKQTEEISSEIADLENRIKLLEVITGKKLWKISIGGIAIVSLLLSIFQLIGVM